MIKLINESWVSTTCPVYSVEHYKLIQDFIKELIDNGYLISTSIRTEQWNDHFERDRKRKQREKQYNPEWFEGIEPIGVIEFYCRDFDNNYSKAKKKIVSYALGLKDKLTEGIIGSSNRYWVTNDDYIPIGGQPDEGYTKIGAIQRAQREADRISNNKRWHVSISDAAKLFHIMNSDGNICHDLDDAI